MPTVRLPLGFNAPCSWTDRRTNVVSRVQLGMLVACLLCSTVPAHAQYRIHVGDVIEISVARVPELKQRVPVQLDGTISFPLLGSFPIAGSTPSEAQAKIQAILATRVFRQRTSDGRESEILIDHDEVTANVVEFRHVYVNGDVSKPGEYAYRPLMTVRQAVALSGGYELMRYRMQNPILESADLRAEYEKLWMDFVREQAHVWRLKTELGDDTRLDQGSLTDAPVARSVVSEIVNVETEQLKIRQSDHERQKTFLQRAITQGGEQIGVLTEQQQKEEQGVQSDIEELQKASDLYGKGSLPSPRVADSRRALLLSSTRKLQTMAQLMLVKRQQDDLSRQVEKLDDQRRMDLLRELQDANLKLGEIRTKLQSTAEKLQYTAIIKSQLVNGGRSQPEIVVVRKGEKGQERLITNEEFELQPGDVVEVALRAGLSTGPASQ